MYIHVRVCACVHACVDVDLISHHVATNLIGENEPAHCNGGEDV